MRVFPDGWSTGTRVFTTIVVGIVVVLSSGCGESDKLSVEQYVDQLGTDVHGLIGESAEELGPLFTDLDNRPGLISNENWRSDVTEALDKSREAHENARAMNPPSGFEDSHSVLLTATECYSDTADRIETALGNENTSSLLAAADIGASCNDLLRDATDAFIDARNND